METKEKTTIDFNKTRKIVIILSGISILLAIGITFNFIHGLWVWVGLILLLSANLFFIIRLIKFYKPK